MITEDFKMKLRTACAHAKRSELKELKGIIEHEIKLSDMAIKEGNETY